MRSVNLILPAIVDGVVRAPWEGPFLLANDEAQRLIDDGHEEVTVEEVAAGGDLSGLKVVDLDKIIADEGVDVLPSANKADKVAAIEAHRAA